MHLREYLEQPDALTINELLARMQKLGSEVKSDAQIRQWTARDPDGTYKRFPSPANAKYLHLASDGRITLQAMRPRDFMVLWPELERRKTPRPQKVAG